MDDLVPRLRGVSHFWALWVAVIGALVLIAIADGATARAVAAVYGAGMCALFAGSATYHRWRWNPRWRPLLRRIDHSTIFVFIAASYTPIAVLVLEPGTLRDVVLIGVWVGAVGGVIFSLAWINAPRWLQAATYIGLGWFAALATPDLIDRLPAVAMILIAAGGVLYTVGAVIYARKKPDPWPDTFGFHEIFHAFVIAAALCHFAAIAGWVVPVPAAHAATDHTGWPEFDHVWRNEADRDVAKRGTAGSDELLGGHGNDRLFGLQDSDVLWGDYKPTGNEGRQRDRLSGGDGDDFLYTSHWRNRVLGGPGSDVVHARYGFGRIDCGPGRDALYLPANDGAYRIRNCEWRRKKTGESAPQWWLDDH